MLALWNNFCGYIRISYHRLLWVFLFAGILYWLIHVFQKGKNKQGVVYRVVFSMTCSFIFVMTLFERRVSDYAVTLTPFWSYYTAYRTNNAELWLQIIMNIVMYIPIGFVLPKCFQFVDKLWKLFLLVMICSVGIECIQYFFSIGYPDIDDVINNLIGTLMGYGGYMLYEICTKRIKRKREGEI